MNESDPAETNSQYVEVSRSPLGGRSRRVFLASTGTAIGAGALAGCLGGSNGDTGGGGVDDTEGTDESTTTPEPEDVTFRLHWTFNTTGLYANFYAARKWTWPEHGVDATIKHANGSQSAAKVVAKGDNKFGSGGFGAVLQMIANGAPLKVLGVISGPWGGVVSLGETGITSWTDLEGKTVGKFPFGSTGPVAMAAMRKKGVNPDEISFQNIQPGSGLKLLKSGKLDAVIRYTPQSRVRLELADHDVNTLRSGAVLDHMGLAFYTHDKVVNKEPDLAEKVVAGWIDGVKRYAAKQEEVVDDYRKFFGEDKFEPKVAERMLPYIYAAQAPSEDVGSEHGYGWLSEDRLQTTIDVFQDAGLLEKSVNPGEVYTNEFVEANQDLAVGTADALYSELEQFDVGPDYF
jgi:NitT/TauT family transport system substrate-binding protein